MILRDAMEVAFLAGHKAHGEGGKNATQLGYLFELWLVETFKDRITMADRLLSAPVPDPSDARYRRCKVARCGPNGATHDRRHAWIPIDRGHVSAVVRLLYPGESEDEFVVLECDTLIATSAVIPFLRSEPVW